MIEADDGVKKEERLDILTHNGDFKGKGKVLDALLKLEYKAKILKEVLRQKQNG